MSVLKNHPVVRICVWKTFLFCVTTATTTPRGRRRGTHYVDNYETVSTRDGHSAPQTQCKDEGRGLGDAKHP